MKMYYAIDFRKMKQLGLNPTKWMICENIHFSQAVAESGYCENSRQELAEHHGISVAGLKRIIRELVEENLLKRNRKNHLKTTSKWHEIGGSKSASRKLQTRGSKNATLKETRGSKNATQSGSNLDARGSKNATLQPIRENLERVRENTHAGAREKKFSFTLKKNTHYSRLSDEYKQKLHAKTLLLDNAKNYEDFLLALESNEKYKYLDFSKVYMKWYKVSGNNAKLIKIHGEDWYQVIHQGKPIAINPITYETKTGKPKQHATQPAPVNKTSHKKPSMALIAEAAEGVRA